MRVLSDRGANILTVLRLPQSNVVELSPDNILISVQTVNANEDIIRAEFNNI